MHHVRIITYSQVASGASVWGSGRPKKRGVSVLLYCVIFLCAGCAGLSKSARVIPTNQLGTDELERRIAGRSATIELVSGRREHGHIAFLSRERLAWRQNGSLYSAPLVVIEAIEVRERAVEGALRGLAKGILTGGILFGGTVGLLKLVTDNSSAEEGIRAGVITTVVGATAIIGVVVSTIMGAKRRRVVRYVLVH